LQFLVLADEIKRLAKQHSVVGIHNVQSSATGHVPLHLYANVGNTLIPCPRFTFLVVKHCFYSSLHSLSQSSTVVQTPLSLTVWLLNKQASAHSLAQVCAYSALDIMLPSNSGRTFAFIHLSLEQDI